MAEWRNTADRITRGAACDLGVSLDQGISSHRTKPLLVNSVRAADERHHRLASCHEHQRLDDLTDLAADSSSRVGRGASARGELPYGKPGIRLSKPNLESPHRSQG